MWRKDPFCDSHEERWRDRRGRRRSGEWGGPGTTGDTELSFAQLGLLALSALPSVPATSWNVRWLTVRSSRQGSVAE